MAEDERFGQPNSGFATIAAGDPAGTVKTVVTNATISVYQVNRLSADLGPGTHPTTQVSVLDDPSTLTQMGTDSGTVFSVRLGGTVRSQGTLTRRIDLDDLALRDFEHDVLVTADATQNSRIDVSVDGFEIRKGQAPDE